MNGPSRIQTLLGALLFTECLQKPEGNPGDAIDSES